MRRRPNAQPRTFVAVVVVEEEIDGEGLVGGEVEFGAVNARGLRDGDEAGVDAAGREGEKRRPQERGGDEEWRREENDGGHAHAHRVLPGLKAVRCVDSVARLTVVWTKLRASRLAWAASIDGRTVSVVQLPRSAPGQSATERGGRLSGSSGTGSPQSSKAFSVMTYGVPAHEAKGQ